MKAISLIKLFTLVCFLMVSGVSLACENPLGVTKDTQCESRYSGDDTKKRQCAEAKECLLKKKEEEDKAKQDKKDKEAECKTALKEYDDAAKKAEEECGRLSLTDIKACREKAAECAAALDISGDSATSSDSAAEALFRILGTAGQMAGGGNSPATAGCAVEDDEMQKEKERIEDKVTRLREEIADLKTKATEADKELDEKRQKVEEEIIDIEKDFDKAKTERETKNQEAAGRIQKAILASEKKRRDNLSKISTLNTKLSNFAFGNMEINLTFADSRIQQECRNVALALRDAKMKPIVDAKTGKKTQPKFTAKESLQFKKDLKVAESNCLQQKALEKQKVIKGLMDNKRELQMQIKELEASNADELKAIENEKKQADALKGISDEEEKKQLEAKFKKLDSLNKSVLDMEKHITEKKKTMGEKAKAKEDQIAELILKRDNLKPKLSKVTSASNANKRAAESFIGSCCPGGKDNHPRCKTIQDTFPDVKKPAATSTTGTRT